MKYLFALLLTASSVFAQRGWQPGPVIISTPGGSSSSSSGLSAVSNAYNVSFTYGTTRYTNATPYYAVVSALFSYSPTLGNSATLYGRQDDDANGSYNFTNQFTIAGTSSALNIVDTMINTIPPGGAWNYTNVIGTITALAFQSSITYYSTNSGSGGGGSGDVTAPGLAAGSHPIAETALTGAFGFSSTNTFFAVNTNAITIATNVVSYNTNSITVTDCPTNAFNVTWYWNSAKDAYTNSTLGSHGLSLACDIPESPGDPAITNGSGGTVFFGLGYDPVNGNSPSWSYSDYNPAGTMQTLFGENFGYTPRHIGNFIGDGSALSNVPPASYAITNNRAAAAGDIFLTNKVTLQNLDMVREDYNINLNYRPGVNGETNYMIINSNGISIAASTTYDRGISWSGLSGVGGYMRFGDGGSLLIRAAGGYGLEMPGDFKSMRLGDDHRQDQLLRLSLQTAGCDACSYETNNYSAMLGFQAKNGADIVGMAGIRSKYAGSNILYNVQGVNYAQSELWFYTLIPEAKAQTNGGFGITGDTNWFLIGRTNSAVVKGLTIASNALSQWPTAPRTHGDSYFANSNGVVFLLTSGVGLTWTATNKIAP